MVRYGNECARAGGRHVDEGPCADPGATHASQVQIGHAADTPAADRTLPRSGVIPAPGARSGLEMDGEPGFSFFPALLPGNKIHQRLSAGAAPGGATG
jgi:hypothetical protein